MLYRLPEELVQEVLERLGQSDLRSLQLVSRWAYGIAAPVRWREVELVDCRTEYEDGFDDHDDTPLIKVLLTLARYVDRYLMVRGWNMTSVVDGYPQILLYQSKTG